jgi:hypothetical protein
MTYFVRVRQRGLVVMSYGQAVLHVGILLVGGATNSLADGQTFVVLLYGLIVHTVDALQIP